MELHTTRKAAQRRETLRRKAVRNLKTQHLAA